jgi:hypothetical protein
LLAPTLMLSKNIHIRHVRFASAIRGQSGRDADIGFCPFQSVAGIGAALHLQPSAGNPILSVRALNLI